MRKAKEENISLKGIKELIPCSLEAVDHLDDLMVSGSNKLDAEIMYAQSIPAHHRRLIDKDYL